MTVYCLFSTYWSVSTTGETYGVRIQTIQFHSGLWARFIIIKSILFIILLLNIIEYYLRIQIKFHSIGDPKT